MNAALDPAVYILFDELYPITERYRSIFNSKSPISARILGRLSAFQSDCDVAVIVSPTRVDSHGCVRVDAKFLSDAQKRSLSNESNRERLIQILGDLSMSGDQFIMVALSFVFMDGIDIDLYKSVAHLTRSLTEHIPPIESL
ncbi:hypothetical protein FGIG_10335 [Fasciola gigantica]|uniref:Uncharacterized protein n=1 Tax=Fasciola gigantica TaxID=46835 RepID=A0A504Y6K7_FASGI|nr:hypothetical protein FGIG_10333 [Fasciola gigantica]TPP56563.1 hypothetical protein FGIG_10335 [Fasciola gigantica]